MKQQPLIRKSDLTGTWLLITRYRELPNGTIEAITTTDVTEEVRVIREGALREASDNVAALSIVVALGRAAAEDREAALRTLAPRVRDAAGTLNTIGAPYRGRADEWNEAVTELLRVSNALAAASPDEQCSRCGHWPDFRACSSHCPCHAAASPAEKET